MHQLYKLINSTPPLLMGVVNITPDSFSDGDPQLTPESAIEHAQKLLAAGASILDLGGESSAPGSSPISAEQELKRLLPVIQGLKNHILSIDTYKSSVAAATLAAGGKMINDISGLRHDPLMAKTIADHQALVVIMHSKEPAQAPQATRTSKSYANVIVEINNFFNQQIDYAVSQGISEDSIILDPGMGAFLSNDSKYSWEVLDRLDELCKTYQKFPILIGVSRKGFLGGSIDERDPISQKVSIAAVKKGAKIIRTHNPAMFQELYR